MKGDLDAARCCACCTHFDGDARSLETRIAGLRVLGSGYASVRDEDGLCARHERFAAARATCAEFAPAKPIPVEVSV
jgi:hypothetical protein